MIQEKYKTISSDFNSDVKHIWIQDILKPINVFVILMTYILIWHPHVQKHKHTKTQAPILRRLFAAPSHEAIP